MSARTLPAPTSSTTPEVSVVVIVHNDAGRLPRAVRSVLGQSLRRLEAIVVDDCSTDGTPRVARELAAGDPRVRLLRLPVNSGGCGAPRNAGLAAARAPYVMFLDSDDELPRHSCKSLLLAAEETGADLVTGEVTRLFEESGTTALWYPELFGDARLVAGLPSAPEYLLDHLSTNKLYRADFLARHGLRFPEDLHYEDQLFSAQALTLARSFAVVPWPVYTWRLADDPAVGPSISSSRHKLRNVADRIAVARRVDAFLEESGHAGLRPAKDAKFLRHDLRLHLGDLPFRDRPWAEEFAALVAPYLAGIAPAAWETVPREQRVCQYLLLAGRLAEAAECARTLDRPLIAPRHTVRDTAGRRYWGRELPQDERAARELDITAWRLDDQPFTTAPLRHEVTRVEPAGSRLRLTLRTYDPARLLAGPVPVTAELRVAATAEPLVVPFRYEEGGEESEEEGGEAAEARTARAEIDLRRMPLGPTGFRGRRHPHVVLTRQGLTRTDPLLAPAPAPSLRARIGGHLVRAGCEGHGAGRFELTWERTGALGRAEALAPGRAGTLRSARRLIRRATGPRAKALAYHELRKLPIDDRLVVFEALEGRGYADSPRYIHEELVRRGLPLRAVWSYSGDRSSFPEGVELVRRGSWEYARTVARARYWVDSHGFPASFAKRTGTRYLQTWHGQAFKHMGFDIPELRLAGPERRRRHHATVARWDALISPSEEFERTFVRANDYAGRLLRTGLPRNDVLVRWNEPEQRDRAARTRERLQIPDGRKVLLYAPTFRDGERGSGASIRADLAKLADAVGEEWTVVVRPHYYERFTVPRELGHAVRDGREFTDLNDLQLASNALLTDYSSVMFDYANLGRPILLYTDDYEDYRSVSRGAYYDLPDIAPGPMLATTEELAAALRDLAGVRERWAGAYARFQERFNPLETGWSSKAVVDMFFEGSAR
ncbi:CDP-glycerol glycerophosphotransferase family protein [Streptomyces sp. UNOB3_S3]|uniref:bifunctional glycosyltransferase/CDP-glycerol:glycerophosphate glycerophosphotransferase n=1 Tax=Streptomyces sp. UNOB3_S3 TaxID=2871682 RepID=UPI001E40A52F|nr:CDP-glycerol glycerophosphotransferase family protein [Streptomyces sp. UNOB3_S3]MCC3779033.1 bifunctional glycosyltransferase family 2 protein/CDP-glycerol:glycerophosphate glycerophosphotransferase [Streptomyces sp. UNOB3_S3]